ncbi:MAG: hypothetical protein ACR2QS_07110 [Woeseiaceae bacterium]
MKNYLIPALLLCNLAFAQGADSPSVEEKLTAAVEQQRLALHYDQTTFSGPAWDRLVAEGRAAKFFLLGEEHGIAENPQLAGQLFVELSAAGYSRFVIEISPTMATILDQAAADGGLDGLRRLFAEPGGAPAFYGMREEAEMLATIRASQPGDDTVFWGTDYEVLGDRQLLKILVAAEKPAAAEAALDNVLAVVNEMWGRYEETKNPQYIFSFAGDPALIRAVRNAWPDADERSDRILNTLEETLTINQFWAQGKGWESNSRRASLQRENFLSYWRAATANGDSPRLMAKFGASHLVRGLSQTAVFDLGTLLPEIAATEGGQTVSLLVLPGPGTDVAALNPATLGYEPQPVSGGYTKGLKPLIDAALPNEFTLIDLEPLRPIVGMNRGTLNDELFRVIHSFDLLLVMSGSTASGNLVSD